jgi:hypothetical protein
MRTNKSTQKETSMVSAKKRIIVCGYAMTPELQALVRKVAHENYMSASAWVRQVLTKAAQESGVTIEGRKPAKPARKDSDAGVSAAA